MSVMDQPSYPPHIADREPKTVARWFSPIKPPALSLREELFILASLASIAVQAAKMLLSRKSGGGFVKLLGEKLARAIDPAFDRSNGAITDFGRGDVALAKNDGENQNFTIVRRQFMQGIGKLSPSDRPILGRFASGGCGDAVFQPWTFARADFGAGVEGVAHNGEQPRL